MTDTPPAKRFNLLTLIGPGILVAATGVGAGDLATGAFTGSQLGVAVLWAVLVGALLKFVLNEGLARWQLATGETLLQGALGRLRGARFVFLAYLLFWSFFVGSALVSACGVAAHAILPLWDPNTDKIVYGILHSAAAVALVQAGGFRWFERIMSVCIGVMFVTVIATTIAIGPDWAAVAKGLFVPTIEGSQALSWTIALMGGVGGTLTVLCYGYWIRESGRNSVEDINLCRIDLAVGYSMTALFGIAMVILGSRIKLAEGAKGAGLVVSLANELETSLGGIGPVARWAFLIGAWGAIGSSLLGVWQSVPYLFADFVNMTRGNGEPREVRTDSTAYRGYLYGLATVPLIGLLFSFKQVQKVYAIFGAAFMPLLAVTLLLLNSRQEWMGKHRNSWLTVAILIAAVVCFVAAGVLEHLPK